MLSLRTLDEFVAPDLLGSLAIAHQVDAVNQVTLPGSAMLVCLLNGVVNHPEWTLRLLEETYQEQTGRTADHSSFGKRMASIKPSYFQAVYEHAFHSTKAAFPSSRRDKTQAAQVLRLRRVDATIVTLSSKLLKFGIKTAHGNRKGTSCERKHEVRARNQVKGVFEIDENGLPSLLHLCQEQKEACDSVALGDPMVENARAGDLFVFDKGCNDRDRLLQLHNAGAFFLTPHHQQGLRVTCPLIEAGTGEAPTQPPQEGASDFQLVRVESAVFENRNKEKRFLSLCLIVVHGLRYDTRAKVWKPMTLLTNLPLEDGDKAGPYPFEELAGVYRSRWEIEIFFRFLKTRLGYRHLTNRTENGITVMIYVTLIAALLLIWYRRKTGINRGWRSVQFRLAENLRAWTTEALFHAFRHTRKPILC